jgi:protein-arginine kinase activator protein McsA
MPKGFTAVMATVPSENVSEKCEHCKNPIDVAWVSLQSNDSTEFFQLCKSCNDKHILTLGGDFKAKRKGLRKRMERVKKIEGLSEPKKTTKKPKAKKTKENNTKPKKTPKSPSKEKGKAKKSPKSKKPSKAK